MERLLELNGFYDAPEVSGYSALLDLETRNNHVLRESLKAFQPDVVHVFSLRGLSKSLIFTLRQGRVPTVFDVADGWMSEDLRNDPWLKWWNQPGKSPSRALKEMTGARGRLDEVAPTRMMRGYDRVPELFGEGARDNPPGPNSIAAFRFERLYFCSQMLKQAAEETGLVVGHGEVIYPGVSTQTYVGEVKPASAGTNNFLVVGRLNRASGMLAALKAIQLGRAQNGVRLSIYGKGESDYIAELRSMAALHRLPVEFLAVSNQSRDLLSLYRRHDVLVHPVEEPEPYAMAPLEAMACGLAVIGTPIGGVGELFRHGENALTFKPGDAADLAARIQELVEQPALREKLAEAGQSDVLSLHNETTVTDQIENYLETARQTWQSQ